MKHICFVGDGVTFGLGDEALLGWPGRLCAGEQADGKAVVGYNLSVATDGAAQIARRWRREVGHRLRGVEQGGVVFCFGLYDMANINNDGIRVPIIQAIIEAEKMIAAAAGRWPVLWIGPAPIRPQTAPLATDTGWIKFSNARLEALNVAYQKEAARLNVPYLNLIDALTMDPSWKASLKRGDGVHPCGDGHRSIAAAVARWRGWRNWIDGSGLVKPLQVPAPPACQGHLTSGGIDIRTASEFPPVLIPNNVPRS